MVVKVEERFKQGCFWKGLTARKRGMPDFFFTKDGQILRTKEGKILLIEIKSKDGAMLSIEQFEIFKMLQDAGIEIAVSWDGEVNEIYRFDPFFNLGVKEYSDRYHDRDFKGKKPERIDLDELLLSKIISK